MSGRVFVIGASWGGLAALCSLVKSLPENFPAPILIVQHTSANGPGRLPQILSNAGPLPASYPEAGEFIRPGRIYIAPPDHHMLVRQRYVWLSKGPRENGTRPAVDALFRSAAIAYGPAVVGIVLTGYLDDGTAGLMAIKGGGGLAVVQDPCDASAPSMPASALKHVSEVDHCCKLEEMPPLLIRLAMDDPLPMRIPDVKALLEIEDRIAEGISNPADWRVLESRGRYSGFTCPECHSALCELPAERVLRFRCRAGHAFSAHSLVAALVGVRDRIEASLYGRLQEQSALAERILADPLYRQELEFAAELSRQSGAATRQMAQINKWSNITLEESGLQAVEILPGAAGVRK